MDTNTTDRLLKRDEVCRRTGLGKSAIYHLMKHGDFPRPYRLSPKAVRWSEAEIEKWIAGLPKSQGAAA